MRRVTVGLGTCGVAAGARAVQRAVVAGLTELGVTAAVRATGCVGLCYREPMVELEAPGLGRHLFGEVGVEQVPGLLAAFFGEGRVPEHGRISLEAGGSEAAFMAPQRRVALYHCGVADPTSLESYLGAGGYSGLNRALAMSPEEVVAEVVSAGLRGRGGAGFPTGRKWALARQTPAARRFLVCNADEGDPGAFMDRNLIEGDPFGVIEGMTIAARAIGAREGIVYVRAEYPLAVERIVGAVVQAREAGLLGPDVLGSGHAFDVEVKRGAGAFVCGEETALIASLEGERGVPRPRPPYPVEEGLWGQPTVINNVESFANVSWILAHGAEAYRAIGTDGSPGTKVFSLAGDVRRTGMVEVPMGTTIRAIVEGVGGGSPSGRPLKAVQIGGPAGGCLPASLFDTPVDYDSLAETGAIMGSGGLIALGDEACMVDVARYFLTFTQHESCGKCTYCRVGTKRMLELLEAICAGEGKRADLAVLEVLAGQVAQHSDCGLGKAAPNPVLTTLRYFRQEYEAHIDEGRCPAGRCRELIGFHIDPWMCDGCTLCRDQCVGGAIDVTAGVISLTIDADRCVRCGGCMTACRFDAVRVT